MKMKSIHFILIFSLITLGQSQNSQRILSFYYCKDDSECDANSFCVGNDVDTLGRCKCREGFITLERNRTYFECLPVAERIGSPCLKDIQCQVNLRTAAVCSVKEKICKCGLGSHLAADNKCYKTVALGEVCENGYNCLLKNGAYGWCFVGHCSCNVNHHPSEDNERCIPSVPLGKGCFESESCIHTSASCYGGICKCVAGYIENDNNTVCLKAANQVGDDCLEDSQCSAYIFNAFCSKNRCSCREAHHSYGNECVRDAYLTETCVHHKECILSPYLEHSVQCTKGICTCVKGTANSENGYGCIIVDNGSTDVYLINLLLLITSVLMLNLSK